MKVLMITGDPRFGPGHERYELQRSAVEELDVVCWPARDSLWSIFKIARHGDYDVITAQDPFWRAHVAHHLRQLFGGKLNIQVHTDLDIQPWHRRLMARYHLWCADSIRVVSQKIKSQVEALGIHGTITVLPIFIDIARFTSIVQMPHSRKTVLWMGRFEKEKDPLLAIDVVKQIPDAHLIMLGDGSLRPQVESAAKGRNVEVVSWQNPVHYLDSADVVLSTSVHESFGASIIEALAAGVPVVAPDVGIAREAGAIVASRSELAKKVAEVLQSGARGQLQLQLLGRKEWARSWRESLL